MPGAIRSLRVCVCFVGLRTLLIYFNPFKPSKPRIQAPTRQRREDGWKLSSLSGSQPTAGYPAHLTGPSLPTLLPQLLSTLPSPPPRSHACLGLMDSFLHSGFYLAPLSWLCGISPDGLPGTRGWSTCPLPREVRRALDGSQEANTETQL